MMVGHSLILSRDADRSSGRKECGSGGGVPHKGETRIYLFIHSFIQHFFESSPQKGEHVLILCAALGRYRRN